MSAAGLRARESPLVGSETDGGLIPVIAVGTKPRGLTGKSSGAVALAQGGAGPAGAAARLGPAKHPEIPRVQARERFAPARPAPSQRTSRRSAPRDHSSRASLCQRPALSNERRDKEHSAALVTRPRRHDETLPRRARATRAKSRKKRSGGGEWRSPDRALLTWRTPGSPLRVAY